MRNNKPLVLRPGFLLVDIPGARPCIVMKQTQINHPELGQVLVCIDLVDGTSVMLPPDCFLEVIHQNN
jgi:hypothetical protein